MSKKSFILFVIVGSFVIAGCGKIAGEVAGTVAGTVAGKAVQAELKSSPSEPEKLAVFRKMESQMRSSLGSFPRRLDAFTVLDNFSFDESTYTILIKKRFDSIKDEMDHHKLLSYFQNVGEAYCQKKSGNHFNVDTSWIVFLEVVVDMNGLLVGSVTTRGLSKDCQIEIQIAS